MYERLIKNKTLKPDCAHYFNVKLEVDKKINYS